MYTTHIKCLVVIFNLLQATASLVGGHHCRQCPLVGSTFVLLVQRWGDKGFKNEESTEIDAWRSELDPLVPLSDVSVAPEDLVFVEVPTLIQRRRPAIRPSGIVDGIFRVVYPCSV